MSSLSMPGVNEKPALKDLVEPLLHEIESRSMTELSQWGRQHRGLLDRLERNVSALVQVTETLTERQREP